MGVVHFPELALLNRSVQADLPIRHEADVIHACLVGLRLLPRGVLRRIEASRAIRAAVKTFVRFDVHIALLLLLHAVQHHARGAVDGTEYLLGLHLTGSVERHLVELVFFSKVLRLVGIVSIFYSFFHFPVIVKLNGFLLLIDSHERSVLFL